MTFKPVKTYHDDWLLFVICESGHVFQFNTEMWPEHGMGGNDSNWPAVTKKARNLVARTEYLPLRPKVPGAQLAGCTCSPCFNSEEFFLWLRAVVRQGSRVGSGL